MDVAAVMAGGQIREGSAPRSSADTEVGDEQRRPEVSEVDGGVGVDPLCTEVGEGRAGVDPADKHGSSAEAAPRVRVGRSSREASRAWTGGPHTFPSLDLEGEEGRRWPERRRARGEAAERSESRTPEAEPTSCRPPRPRCRRPRKPSRRRRTPRSHAADCGARKAARKKKGRAGGA